MWSVMAWPIARCRSSASCGVSALMGMATSAIAVSADAGGASASERMPISVATLAAVSRFGEAPLVLSSISRSPPCPRFRICSANTWSNDASLDHAVINPMLPVNAMALIRSLWVVAVPMVVLQRSVARWSAVFALPPFPAMKIVRFSRQVFSTAVAAGRILADSISDRRWPRVCRWAANGSGDDIRTVGTWRNSKSYELVGSIDPEAMMFEGLSYQGAIGWWKHENSPV